MYHNVTLKVMFFAGDKEEWRVYTDSGQYWTAKSIDEIPKAIIGLLRGAADLTLKRIPEIPQ